LNVHLQGAGTLTLGQDIGVKSKGLARPVQRGHERLHSLFCQGLDLRPRPIGKRPRRIEEGLSTAKHREVTDLDEEQRPAFAPVVLPSRATWPVFGVHDGKISSLDIYFDSAPFPK
jgi:hypothetical protein